jgi:hypothetical protein
MLRDIDHFIAGEGYAPSGRTGDVFDPNRGEVQAKVKLGTSAELDLRLHFAAVGVEHVAGASARGKSFAGDEMVDVTQHCFPSWFFESLGAWFP